MNSSSETGFYAAVVRRPVAVTMMVITVIVFGLVSLGKLKSNLLPDISYPSVTVRTAFPGAAPEDVEEKVSERMQESLSTIADLVRIWSVSRAETSDVIMEFAWGTNITFALQDVREKLDRVFLPPGAERPIILRYDPNLDPILRLGIASDRNLTELRKICDDLVKRDLEVIEGVAAVRIKGGFEEEVLIALDPAKMDELNIDPSYVVNRLREENLNAAGGKLEEGDSEYIVRTLNLYSSIRDIQRTPILLPHGQRILLQDIAQVERTQKERELLTKIDGREAIEIDIYREADANIVDLADRIRTRIFGAAQQQEWLAQHPQYLENHQKGLPPDFSTPETVAEKQDTTPQAEDASAKEETPEEKQKREAEAAEAKQKQRYMNEQKQRAEYLKMTNFLAWIVPPDLSVSILSDQSRFIRESINDVSSSAIIGGLLSVIAIFLFLRALGSTLVISVSIPISIIATFGVMYLSGVSLNVMSLGGLAIGIGMLIDDSIVVLESIARCREEGDNIFRAAVRGVQEVGGAVIATELTSVAVFFPILFVEGIAGQMFGDQALTVVTCLLVSLVVSLTFVPMLAGRTWLRAKETAGDVPQLKRFFANIHLPLYGGKGIFRIYKSQSWQRFGAITRYAWRPVVLLLWTALLPLSFFILIAYNIVAAILILIGRLLLRILGLLAFISVRLAKSIYFVFKQLAAPVHAFFDLTYGTTAKLYPKILLDCLKNPAPVIVGSLLLMLLTIWRIPSLGSELLPEVHQGEFTAEVSLAVGTPLEETEHVLRDVEKLIKASPDVASTVLTVGSDKEMLTSSDEGEHTAKLTVVVSEGDRLAQREDKLVNAVRSYLESMPEVRSVRFRKPTLFSFSLPIEIEIKGHNLDTLAELTAQVEDRLREIPALTDIRSTMQRGNPEIHVRFDRQKLVEYGLVSGQVSTLLQTNVLGNVPTAYVEAEDRIDMRVKAEESSVTGLSRLQNLVVNPGMSPPIPLKAIAQLDLHDGPAEIRRIGNQRAVVVTATSKGIDLGTTSEQIEQKLAGIHAPIGYSIELGGQKQEMDRAITSLQFAIYLSIFLVFIVMAAQFESMIHPLIIMVSVPLSIIGMVFAMDLTSTTISVISLIGGVILVGIVVDNAVILLDRVKQQRDLGQSIENALIEAANVRFRPIMMTAITTILGLLPMTGWLSFIPGLPGAGEGYELRAPLAIAVIGGMISSTVLTLVVIPVVYHLVEKWRTRNEFVASQ